MYLGSEKRDVLEGTESTVPNQDTWETAGAIMIAEGGALFHLMITEVGTVVL